MAPLVLTRGTLSSPDGSIRVSNVQVLGVDERFWRLAPNLKDTPIGKEGAQINSSSWNPDTFFVNQRLGKRLNHASQARLILRMEEPSLFSRDAPLSGERDNKFISMNQELGEIIAADGFGSFGLKKGGDIGFIESLAKFGLPYFVTLLYGICILSFRGLKEIRSLRIKAISNSNMNLSFLQFAVSFMVLILIMEIHYSVWYSKSILPFFFFSLALFDRYLNNKSL